MSRHNPAVPDSRCGSPSLRRSRGRISLVFVALATLVLTVLAAGPSYALASPSITDVVPGNATLAVSYSSVSGATGYGYSLDGAPPMVCGANPCVISGLSNGTAYQVRAAATDGATWTYSDAITARAGTPSAPVITATSTTSTELVIDYTPPTVSNGTIVDYEFYVNGTRIQNAQYWASAPFTSPLRAPVSGLTAPYTIRMAAVNNTGLGVFTTYSEGAGAPPTPAPTVPGAPEMSLLGSGVTTVTVRVWGPADEGGSPVTAVRVNLNGDTRIVNPGSAVEFGSLSPGTSYTVTAEALNVVGWGPSSQLQLSTAPPTPPSAPGIEVVERGTTFVVYRLSAPASDGGSRVLTYSSTLDGVQTSGADPLQRITVSSLIPGRTYVIEARAQNSLGWSVPTQVSVQTLGVAPSAPSFVRAVASKDAKWIDVSWGAAEDGGVPIQAYRVSMGGYTWCSVASSTRSCRIPGARPGTTPTIEVSARNAVGSGPSRSTTVTMPVGPPSAPVMAFVFIDPRPWKANGGTYPKPVNIGWELPQYTGGSPIDSIEFKMPGVTFPWGKWECRSQDFAKGSCQIYVDGDYPQDSPLSIRIRNEAGFWSTWLTVRMKQKTRDGTGLIFEPSPTDGPPVAPSGLAANSQGSRTVVSWAYPSEVSGVAPDSYVVIATCTGSCPAVPVVQARCAPFDPPGSCVLNGLLGGVAYSVSVTARNGSGASSPATVPVTGSGAPRSPSAPSVAWEADRVRVSWSKVPGSGISYVVSSGETTVCTTTQASCLVPPVAPPSSYTVAAVREGYVSPPSPASAVIGVVPPPTPTQVSARQVGLTRATVTWRPPDLEQGSPPLVAEVKALGSPDVCRTAAGAGTCELTLPEGFMGDVEVTFSSAVSLPSASAVYPLWMRRAPAPPSNLMARVNATGNVVLAAWQWSGNALGLEGFLVRAYADGRQVDSCEASSYRVDCALTRLATGRQYTLTVEAVGEFGNSAATPPVTVSPGPLLGAKAVTAAPSGADGLVVSWQVPDIAGGRALLLNSFVEVDGPEKRSCTRNDGNRGTSCEFTGLQPGDYTARVTLDWANGAGPTSDATSPVRVGAPHAPTELTAEQEGAAVRVSWQAPRFGPRPTSYNVTVSGGLGCIPVGSQTSCVIRGSEAGQPLRISVAAVLSGRGSGPMVTTSFTPVGLPSAVGGLRAEPIPGGLRVTWAVPDDTAANRAAEYDVAVLTSLFGGFSVMCSTSFPTNTCDVTGLDPGQTVGIQVNADNPAGTTPSAMRFATAG